MNMRLNPFPIEVACTLRDLQPLSFYGKNKILYLVTGLYLHITFNIAAYYLP